MRTVALLLWSLGVVGGCASSSDPICPTSEGELVEGIPCERADQVARWIERLAARPLSKPQRDKVMGELQARAGTDRVAFDAAIRRVEEALGVLESAGRGVDAARVRAQANHAAHRGEGPLPRERWPAVDGVRKAAVSVWSADDDDRLVLTEMDIEGWIRFASLCREAQGGTPLKLSVGDRLPGYREVVTRFEQGPTSDRLGLVLLGGSWRWMAQRWMSASYDEQQAWIGSAPFPPPMTGTSRDYLSAVTAGSPKAHVDAWQEALGPIPGLP